MEQQLLFGVGREGASPFVCMESTQATTVRTYSKNKPWIKLRKIRQIAPEHVWIFTDGSSSGWHSAVLVFPGLKVVQAARWKKPTPTRNVGAELNGMLLGLKRVKTKKQIYLVHDYLGVGAWMTGNWKMKDQEVRSVIDQGKALIAEKQLDVRFIHHAGHQKDASDFTRWNGVADELCSAREKKTLILPWHVESTI